MSVDIFNTDISSGIFGAVNILISRDNNISMIKRQERQDLFSSLRRMIEYLNEVISVK